MKRSIIVAGVTLAISSSSVALSVTAKPLPKRDGTVIAWNAKSKTTIVSTVDRRVYVLHGLRKSTPGTRVRINGIKWGTPTKGIKWGKAPKGIKWGIKWASNGTYKSGVAKTGRTSRMSLRATVVRRVGKKGVVLSVPGATLGIKAGRGAVWIPRLTKRTKAVSGSFGTTVIVDMAGGKNGVVTMTSAREVAAPPTVPNVPFAGTILSINRTAGTMRVQVGSNGVTTVLTLQVPAGTNIATLKVGTPVTGTAKGVNANKPLTVTTLARNTTFAAADVPIPVPQTTNSTTGSTTPTAPGAGDSTTEARDANGARPNGSNSAGTDPGTTPGTDPGTNPGTDPGTNPGSGLPAAKAQIASIRTKWTSNYWVQLLKPQTYRKGLSAIDSVSAAITAGKPDLAIRRLDDVRDAARDLRDWPFTSFANDILQRVNALEHVLEDVGD